jgi:hypothetical protein
MLNRGPTLTVRPWDVRDGDPASPKHVFGVPVDHLLATRLDAAGALVALQDRRVALAGPIGAIGRPRALRSYVRGRARGIGDRADRDWLEHVSTVLARMDSELGAPGALW